MKPQSPNDHNYVMTITITHIYIYENIYKPITFLGKKKVEMTLFMFSYPNLNNKINFYTIISCNYTNKNIANIFLK